MLKTFENYRKYQTLNTTLVESIFQLTTFFIMIFCYMRMVLCSKKIHTCAVLMIRMWCSNSEDIQEQIFKIFKIGYHITIFQAVSLAILCVSFGVAPVVIPSFLNWAYTGNQTYEKTLPLHTELFLNEDEYFYRILTAHLASLFIYSLLISAMNNFQCTAVSFIIGQIRGLEFFLHKIDAQFKCEITVNEKEGNLWICEQLQEFVRMHQTVIEFYNIARDISNMMMFVVLMGSSSIVVLTTTSMVLLMETDLVGSAKMLFAFGVAMCAITFVCIPSQMLRNASDDLFFTCYEINLQNYPVKMQKLLLLVMARALKPFVLTAGPTIELNLETCSTIIKSSLSYAATFRSFYLSL